MALNFAFVHLGHFFKLALYLAEGWEFSCTVFCSGFCSSPSPFWFHATAQEAQTNGGDASVYASSTIVQTSAPKELGQLRQADGEEGFASKVAAKAAALANGLANGVKASH